MQTHAQKKYSLKRVPWIDICRGIAIISVLYGHLFTSTKHQYLIYAFHMPLFFFISGLVFKPTQGKPFLSILVKYIKQLLLPYYLLALLTYLFAIISQTAGNLNLAGIAYQLFGIIYGNGNDGMLGYNVVLWFLPCLFITKLTFDVITRKIIQTKYLLVTLFVSAACGALSSSFLPWIKLPFGFETAFTGITFFGAGYLVIKHKEYLAMLMQQKKLLGITTTLLTILVATLNYRLSGGKIDIRVNYLGNVFLFYLAAFGGIATCVAVSKMIAKNFFLEYIGRHSMALFAWHNILFVDLENFINSLLDQNFIYTMRFLMPTFYVGIAMSIILFSRMILVKLKTAYRLVPFTL